MNILPNGVKVPDGLDLVDPAPLLKSMADSFSDALGGLGTGKRQPRTFGVASQSEKSTLAGLTTLTTGDRAFVADTGWWELYDSLTGWKVWQTTRGVAWPFAHTGITVGNGQSNFVYTVQGDLITLTGTLTWGSTTSMPANTGRLVLPFGMLQNGAVVNLGPISASSGGAQHMTGLGLGAATTPNTLVALMFDTGATNGALSAMSGSVPRAWAPGDVLGLNLRWVRA